MNGRASARPILVLLSAAKRKRDPPAQLCEPDLDLPVEGQALSRPMVYSPPYGHKEACLSHEMIPAG